MNAKHLLMSLLCVVMPLAAGAYDFEVDGLYFNKTNEGEVSVVKGDKQYSGDVVVPTSITVDGVQYAVTAIGQQAFEFCAVNSIVLPEGLKRVEGYSLACQAKEVNIPSTIEEIGHYAFAGGRFKDLRLPEGLRVIEDGAFEGTPVREVVIPSTVSSIGVEVFSGAGWDEAEANGPGFGLDHISVAEGNPYYDSREDCNAVIETATNKLVVGTNNTVIPSDVKVLGSCAFSYCNRMTKIIIPASVEKIDINCFLQCYKLTDIYVCRQEPAAAPRAFGHPGLDGFDFDHVVLHVPMGCKDAYAAANTWSYFKNIVEFDPSNMSDPTGIGLQAVETTGGNTYYSADGKQLQSPQRGMNIVRQKNGTSVKVVVK